MKDFSRLVPDIYKLMCDREIDPSTTLEAEAEHFAQECKDIFLSMMAPDKDRSGKLRMSGIGKPMRQQYNAYHGVPGEELEGATYIKFFYGHLIEAMLVALARASGHSVQDQQKEVEVGGIKGHIDGVFDGVLIDVKSASTKAFKKFDRGELHKDDPFGYIAQIKGYGHALGHTKFGWLVLDKTTGQLCTLMYDTEDKDAPYAEAIAYDIEEHIETVKKSMGSDEPPPLCYPDEPAGKSGNRKLAMGCAFCPYKHHCWKDLRAFKYANYTEYLTVVDKTPRVEELPDGF